MSKAYPCQMFYIREAETKNVEKVPTMEEALRTAEESQKAYTLFSGKPPMMTLEATAEMVIKDAKDRIARGVVLAMDKIIVKSKEHEVEVRMELSQQKGFVRIIESPEFYDKPHTA